MLSFRCTGCGNCCRDLHVAVTGADLARLIAATGRTAQELVDFLAPDEVDMSGEPDGFIELRAGRRLMVLRRENDACHLLDGDQRCRVYEARPRDCVAFPFEVEPFSAVASSAGEARIRRLELLKPERCEAASDGSNDPAAIAANDSARARELEMYRRMVADFNRQAARRRRFGHRVPDAQAFFDFLLASQRSETP